MFTCDHNQILHQLGTGKFARASWQEQVCKVQNESGGRPTGGLRGPSGSSTRFSAATSPTHSTLFLDPFIATPVAPSYNATQPTQNPTNAETGSTLEKVYDK